MINIVIPMAGLGSRFVKAGYKKPKPFIDILGKTMIERVIENLYYPDARYILLAREEHLKVESDAVNTIIKNYDATFLPIGKLTEGAACTVLHARELINNDVPLLLANSDQIIDIEIGEFTNHCKRNNFDGSIITFEDDDKKWSYAKLNEEGCVTMVKEKVRISQYATAGVYLFSKGHTFVDGAIDMIARNDRTNNEFYVCPVYNYAIKNGAKIGIYNIQSNQMHGTGTPEDLEKYMELIK